MVKDSEGQLIIEGEALLLTTTGTLIKTVLIEKGVFLFKEIAPDNYTLQLSATGYETEFREVKPDVDISISVVLITKAIVLDEVAINSENKMFTNHNGNIKVDVANSIFKASPSPLDLMAKLPSVIVSADKESLSIIGRGDPLIYIDNQKVGMNDLNALSVEDIKTIEIIKNPSAKYEAEGRAVVFITRKRSRRDGFEISGLETASFKRGYNNYTGVNTGFKKGKTEFKANFNYNKLYHWEANGNNVTISDARVATNYKIRSISDRAQYIFGGGIFHQFNDDDYISANVNAKLQGDDDRNHTQTYILQNNTADNITTLSRNDNQRNFVNSFINYNKKIKSLDAKLFTGLQYSNFYQTSYSDVQNNYNDTQFVAAQHRNQKFTVNAFTGRADAEKVFKNDIKLEVGALYLSATAKTNFAVDDYVTPAQMQSLYDFREQNAAGYTQLSGKVKKLSYSGGLRVETTDIEGKYNNTSTLTIDKHYTNIFPKAQLDYAIDSTMSVSLNYAKSIARPNYSSTSQVTVYGSPFMVFASNLNLNPTITDEVSAGFQYKEMSATMRYYTTKDPSYATFTYDTAQTLISLNTINYAKESGFTFETVIPFSYKLWTVNNVLSMVLNKIEDPSALLSTSKPYLYYYSNNTFKLPKAYTAMLSVWGTTKRNEGIFTRNAFFIMDVGFTKTFFKSLDCTLSFNDVFRNMNFNEDFAINNISSRGRYYTDTREIALSLKYKFGNFKGKEERRVNENEGRIR
ncbi:TonB-dependent receptor [Flavobacterium rivuli WB 3.3-2 = DSM 21788]|uniref:TonB-dependent receptor n=1 Tax=Flavobacterium rivuli WB 3.3-2 = DSM 21788 TaxID=1121895 RepID=A0A0A2MA70_9FLAO|nr:outer membrane beta-barrel family protein [Flavobacterium rivuli]KGO88353.1 TonB-dependent receptor [Flavobacterium rivuli WB 3.3-2 = DSM 21788]